MSKGQSHRRTDSQRKALERCKSKLNTNDVIDVDGEKIPDFIIIDPPEPSEQTLPDARITGKDKTPAPRNIICIDDDDDDENVDCGSFQNGSERNGNQDVSDKSNKSLPTYDQGRGPSSKSTKSWGACSGKIPSLRRRNYAPSTSYENDDSDCDLMEDYQGNIRKQWQKASLKKKKFENVSKGQSDPQGEVSYKRFTTKVPINNVSVNKTAKASIPSNSSYGDHEKGNLGSSVCTGEDLVGVIHNKPDVENQSADLEEAIKQKTYHKTSVCKNQVVNAMDFNTLNPSVVVSDGVGTSNVQNCIIGGREILKKTNAYKRAEEEEWASRQRELQIQAEEAQRLRKRRKAETMRLLEMERRQKQRVEEIREAHKKDEETLNLKEQLRIEVRRELNNLEANSRDMASLLRGLGISIGGGFYPSPSEVRAAYKQAQLKFHPDRASRSGIRQQIEAEEKFKLISRAKEKFML